MHEVYARPDGNSRRGEEEPMGSGVQPRQRTWGNAVPSLSEAAELKRASIVRAAAQCFNRSGFHGTSMDDIAERLGVTKAALYRYVSGKHELLFDIFNIALDSGYANLERGEAEGR